MSDKPFTLDLPEELLAQAKSAQIDVRRLMIDALQREVARAQAGVSESYPLPEVVEKAVQDSLRRVASDTAPSRILGLNAGGATMSDDFDAPLPDDFWLCCL
jgi:hypothetical protein